MVTGPPVLPVRSIVCRYAAGRWLPCPADDRRGTLLVNVDAEGRTVEAVHVGSPYGSSSLAGWRLAHGDGGLNPADVLNFLAAQATRRRTARTSKEN
jgi:hypothetical protein